jgi:hypothetical protein
LPLCVQRIAIFSEVILYVNAARTLAGFMDRLCGGGGDH